MFRRDAAVACSLGLAAVTFLSMAFLSGSPASAQTAAPAAVSLRPLDADGDDKISRAEWTAFVQTFSQLDADKNQAVDEAELKKAAGDDTRTPGVLAAADSDGNGRLTRPEWSQLARGFARYDKDGDGFVTQSELQAVVDAVKAASQPRAGGNSNGLWRGYIVQGRGEQPNRGQQIELAIAGNRIAGREVRPNADNTPNLGVGTYVMTGNGQSGYLDAQYVEGPNSGQVCLGIYKVEGDALYWCASNRNGNRPADFATGNGNWLMILRKVDAAQQ